MLNQVNICGISYKIEYVTVIDEGNEGITMGKIVYAEGKILLKTGLPKDIEKEVLIHEMVHGILFHLGKTDMTDNEELVQLLAHGIYESFELKR